MRMMRLAYRMPMVRMNVPTQLPTSMNVTVMLVPPQTKKTYETSQQCDISKRPTDKVVASMSRPMQPEKCHDPTFDPAGAGAGSFIFHLILFLTKSHFFFRSS